MPYADPNASFDSAVRHLFRYLDNAHQLKRNPLVRRLFADVDVPVTSARARDKAALALVRRFVREAAERYCEADATAGRHEYARCKRAIVLSNLLGNESVESVAQAVGVSAPHCYRLRADLCRRIAQHIQRYNDVPTSTVLPVLDEFRARICHAILRGQIGDFGGAADEYERLAQSTGSIPRKVEALAGLSRVLAEQSRLERAEEVVSLGRALLDEHCDFLSPSTANVARAQIEFARWGLATHRYDGQASLDAIALAASHLDAVQGAVPDHVSELYAEVLLFLSWTLRNYGNSRAAEERALYDAVAVMGRVRFPRPTLALQIGLVLERTRNTRHDAADLIERAVPKLEEVRAALPLRYCYTVAAEITGDTRFLRKAEEVAYLLAH